MNLRERLTLSIIIILILFSVNVGTDSWSNSTRNASLTELRQAVTGQLQASALKQNLEDLHKAILLLSSLRSTLDEKLTPQETSQALGEIAALQDAMQQLALSNQASTYVTYKTLESSFLELIPLWKSFYQQYNNVAYDNYEDSDYRELVFKQTLNDLETLKQKQIQVADRQSIEIEELESLTNAITITVFLTSIVFTIVLGIFLINYTNSAFRQLKKGTIIIGGGDLDYRIPLKNRDEVGEVAEAFNAMSSKLQHAINEAQLARKNADLANRAKSNFLANMSHELRTPLNAIIGYSEMMLEDIELEDIDLENQEKDLQKVLTAGRHLLNQINDVLDFSKIETGKMTAYNEEFDSITVLKEVISTISPLANKGNNNLNFEHDNHLPLLFNDITKFRQIFFNLLSNSCKFTQQGQIKLSAEYDESTFPPTARFKVNDNGIGMTAEQTDIVFDAFIQADSSTTRKYGGTGLGLALCKQYCELMGGSISVESSVEKGTTFTVEFLITNTDNLNTPAATKKTKPSHHKITTVLVIDDDPVALALTERFLHRGEYRTLLAENGKHGIALAEKEQPDIILLDIMMPGIDGWTVLSLLKESANTQAIPVILVSMLDEKNLGMDLGAIDYLRKPIDWETLSAIMDQLEQRRTLGTVLLVEKKSTQRDILNNALNQQGWQVICCDNPNTAKQYFNNKAPKAVIASINTVEEQQAFEGWVNELCPEAKHEKLIIICGDELAKKHAKLEDIIFLPNKINNAEKICKLLSEKQTQEG